METKICTTCKKEFPALKQYFHALKSGKYGLHSKCKTCKNKIDREHPKYKERIIRGMNKRKQLCAEDPEYAELVRRQRIPRALRPDATKEEIQLYKKSKKKEWIKYMNKKGAREAKRNRDMERYKIHNENLTDSLLAGKIQQSIRDKYNVFISQADIPQELIKLKRKQLKLYRHVKKTKSNSNS